MRCALIRCALTIPRMSAFVRTVVMALALNCAAFASGAIDANDLRAARGVTGSVELEYQPTHAGVSLRAKAMRDSTAPIMARVTELGNARYRIEYLGVVSGQYDLAPLLEESDGRAASNLAALHVEIFTQLPPQHGSDVFGLASTEFGIAAYYRVLLTSAIVAWCMIPLVVLLRRYLRRAPQQRVVADVIAPSARDMLRDAVAAATAREPTLHERARLELLLLQVLRDEQTQSNEHPRAHASLIDLAHAMTALRQNERCAPVILAVERWLHAQDIDESTTSVRANEALRVLNTMTPRHDDGDDQLRARTNEDAT